MQAIIYTDQQVVEGIRQKNQVFLNYFYDRYAGAFYGEIKRILLREENACETFELVFENIWTALEHYDYKQPLFIWAFRLVQKLSLEQKMNFVFTELFSCQQIQTVSGRRSGAIPV